MNKISKLHRELYIEIMKEKLNPSAFMYGIGHTNMENYRGEIFLILPEHLHKLFLDYIKKYPQFKEELLGFYYTQGLIAVEKKYPKYALELLNNYIKLTKDNKDTYVHNKYYSRGLAYFNLKEYSLAKKDFEISLKFTKDKRLVKEVEDILKETNRKITEVKRKV